MSRASVKPRGVSLPELLVVIAILALFAMVAIPLAGRRVHQVKLRASVEQFEVSLRAARMIAVSRRVPVDVTVDPCPASRYSYVDSRGHPQAVGLPPGVWIDPASTPTITFQPNGSLEQPSTTIIESRYAGQIERWTVTVPIVGIPALGVEGPMEATGSLPCDNPGGS